MLNASIDHNPLLFGRDRRTGIVAIEPAGRFIRLFFRVGGQVHFRDEPFQPFILTAEPAALTGCSVACSVRQLSGDAQFRYQLLFENWSDCLAARDFVAQRYRSAADFSYLFFPDPVHQYMLSSGTTLFKELDFSELRTLAIDIETACTAGYSFSNAERPGDRIISIALKDSYGHETVLKGDLLDESDLLQALNEQIRQFDPDVITGHNLFRFDLDYIGQRAHLLGVRLNWGRNGAVPRVTPHARWTLVDKTIEYPRWDVYGRHIIDTYFLVQLYDVTARSLESYGLKNVARFFGIAAAERTYVAGERIDDVFKHDPEQLYRYNLDDTRETAALFQLLGYPWFLQSRIFPYSFQNCVIRGNATRINSLFLREYLFRGHAIPHRSTAVTFEGGHAETVITGITGPVVHCDVASLYPSLMLAYQLAPSHDRLELFLPMLADLRHFRLAAKQAARESADAAQQAYYEALQQVFKVLINSFYGYLGAAQHNFSDPAVAAEVTRLGRVTIRNMIEILVAEGAQPIEVDTDGIYFRPPLDCISAEDEADLVRRISLQLPEGIDVELDGRYRSMFAYKTKNYALQGYDGTVTVRGSALRSRGVEPFLGEFIREVIERLVSGRSADVEKLYEEYCIRLRSRTLEVTWVARSETLSESPQLYQEKIRNGTRHHAAAYEIALASPRQYRAGDHISYYVSGFGKSNAAYEQCRSVSAFDALHPDINVQYYIDKLRQVKKRFDPYLPQEPTLFDL